jgi:hypothetical protein
MRFTFKIVIVAFMLSGWSTLPAQENHPQGFLNISFGATREAWLTELTSLFKMKPNPYGLASWPMYGSGMDLLWTSNNVYCLKNFVFSDRRFTVLFYFNNDSKFYGFRLKENKYMGPLEQNETSAVSEDSENLEDPEEMCKSGLSNIESKNLLDDVHFLEKVFEEKYGSPTKVQEFNTDDICQKADRVFWIQKTSRYLTAIGTITTVFVGGIKKRPDMHSTIAVVYDQELRGEPTAGETMFFPEGPPHVAEERTTIQKAAGSF